MSAIDICFCILILSSAFALVGLGVFFFKTATSMKHIGETAKAAQTTIVKVDRVVDNVAYKLDLLDAPFETIAGIFDPKRPKFNVLNVVKSIIKKKKG